MELFINKISYEKMWKMIRWFQTDMYACFPESIKNL